MDPDASDHTLQPCRDHQPHLLVSTRTMELTCDRVKPVKPAEDDAEMADLPSAVTAEARPMDALSPQNQPSNTSSHQPAAPTYHVPAHPGNGGEQVRVSPIACDSWVDNDTGDEDSEVDSDGSDSESEEMQESDMDSDVDVDGNDETSHPDDPDGQFEPADDFLKLFLSAGGPNHGGVYLDPNDDHRSIFVDFEDGTDVDTETESTGEASETEVDVTDTDYFVPAIVPAISSIPDTPYFGAMRPPQRLPSSIEPLRLARLLRSSGTPGRGLYELERALDHEQDRVAELERMRQYIEAGLRTAKARQDKIRAAITNSKSRFSKVCAAAGISDELWREYEAFCESLEPPFGSRGGWSVTCFEDHGGSYVKYDPDLELFVESAEVNLGTCNFRCEASVETTRFGKHEYLVEFWPLAIPEPRIGDENTWGEQYPNLYRLATQAADDPTRSNRHVAQELLRSLPDQYAYFSGGWLFEYHPEPARADHPVKSRKWSYRSAHKIDVPDHQEQVERVESVDGDESVKTELADEQQDGLMALDTE